MVKIQSVNWISKEALEAEVVVTDGQFELLCFGQPFNMQEGEQLAEPLHALDAENVMIVTAADPKLYVKKLNHAFDYMIVGKLIDKKAGYVKLGDIVIDIGSYSIPNDLENGNYISFECDRLDIWLSLKNPTLVYVKE